MKDKPIIFSASIGNGHTQAAKALHDELLKQGYTATIVDTFYELNPYLHHFMLHTYLNIIKWQPFAWRKLYFQSEHVPLFNLLDKFGGLFVKQLYPLVNRDDCPFIISTHPFVTAFLSHLIETKKLTMPFYTVITDFVLHPAYLRDTIDGYFTASCDTTAFATKHNISSHLFTSTGIPILSDSSLLLSKKEARLRLGISLTDKVVVIAGGGRGLTNYCRILKSLESLDDVLHIICMVGENSHAMKKLSKQKSKHKLRIVSFTDQFIVFLKASDVILSKAGGVTMAEALVCETPIVLFRSVPGHEEQNAHYLTNEGAAVSVSSYRGLAATIFHVLYRDDVRERLITRARSLKKPFAAHHIISTILMEENEKSHLTVQ
ncbi:glycosyltransferase [Salipaludibacillus sp. LMS25]|jgi:processive 1,2-diacylglycerol beta-glucosyltransferase|uniref:MGDG synthase family glycosyltransferase n=1 Tax=Salipaludibacillus sp. LMS25 TaxID=2924031 RepID=UPI0020D03B1D|nr:glycosyltransferase [Salipaludibacillus sp. LMS25]UTR14735.1 glycosyltransferase [Salipaludibacillus sp. LMS25]